jgi:hypothetical protein
MSLEWTKYLRIPPYFTVALRRNEFHPKNGSIEQRWLCFYIKTPLKTFTIIVPSNKTCNIQAQHRAQGCALLYFEYTYTALYESISIPYIHKIQRVCVCVCLCDHTAEGWHHRCLTMAFLSPTKHTRQYLQSIISLGSLQQPPWHTQ